MPGGEPVDAGQHRGEQGGVLGGEELRAFQRLFQLGDLAAGCGAGQLGQDLGVALARRRCRNLPNRWWEGEQLGAGDAMRPDSSRVLVTGNAACFMRVRALEASRAVISAPARVRSSSSGAHRWVFAVISSSGRAGACGELEPPQPGGQVRGQ